MRRRGSRVAALAALCLLAGCGGTAVVEPQGPSVSVAPQSRARPSPEFSPPVSPAQSPSSTPPPEAVPSPSATATKPAWLDDWKIGAHVLPLRPDGYGVVRRTPRELRVRRMPTVDVLPPPATDEYASSVSRITPRVRKKMGTSWEPGCPVALRDLRYVRVVFWGFDHKSHTGELIVNAAHAEGITEVFRKLYDRRFPIEQMTLPTTNKPDPTPTGDGDGTASMVCRPTTGAATLSAHAYGLALDLNPFQNPYVKDDLVIPELASAYLDRSWRRPGMVHAGGPVVRAFADIGWSWGGDWHTLKDYQHFTATGR